MDVKIKKCCPNCSQLYFIKSLSGQKPSNLPLYLTCGHTMCENCISNIVKFEEPIECKVCHRDIQLSADELSAINAKKVNLHHFFPVNYTMLGELTMQLFEQNTEPSAKKDDQYFVDLKSIIQGTDNTQGKCAECHIKTIKMCQECQTILCDSCFNKSHKNFVIFKNHILKNIEQVPVPNNCKVHKGKPLDYYCHDCTKSICMDCLMVGGEKSCKNHNIVSMQEVNDSFFEDIVDITPKVDETFRRLTKTAVDVGHLLHNIENETGPSSELNHMLAYVKQHFSKLTAAIQKHEKEVVDIIVKLKCSEKESLRKAKNDLTESIKKAKAVLNSINACSDREKAKQLNLSVLLDEAKQILEIPWYLSKDESKDPLKVVVNEDLCTLVTDYVQLQGNASSVYALRSTTELGEGVEIPPPPPAPVYPPELPKDVRQMSGGGRQQTARGGQGPVFHKNVPQYRTKSGSVSSLNSLHSDISDRSFGDAYYHQGSQGYQNYQRQTVHKVQPFPGNHYPKHENGGFHQMHQDYQNYQRLLVHQVQPVPKSQQPKPLSEGDQELIYITHMVDPHNLFVQRTCDQKLVKEMLRSPEFRNANAQLVPSLNHVGQDKTYLVFNKADNMWQRCRILSIDRKDPNNPSFLVFCIDFGSTETVRIDKLRVCPPARAHSPHPLAINCALANCEPRGGHWTTDDALLIQKIVDNKQAVIYVRHIRATANDMKKVECDVTTFEDGISLAHALVFHERARMPNPKLMYPKILGVMEKPKIFMSTNDLKPKAVEEVYITHIVSPDKFFVRKKHLKPVYEKLCEDLEVEYGITHTGNVYLPEIGMSYVANVENVRELSGVQLGESGQVRWCRCVVTELPGRGRVRAALVDCGAAVILHWTALRYIHHKFTTQTALATECHLAGVTPLNKKWSEKSVALLQRFEDRLLELHVEDTRRGSAGVTLYDKSDEDNIICVNTEMIKYKFAVTFGLPTFNKHVEDQVFTNKYPLDEPQRALKPTSGQPQILKKNQTVKTVDEKELDAKDKGPLRLEAKILHYQSPSLLYLSLVHQQKAFSELYEQIQEYYTKNKTQGKEKWEVGDRCCTVCNQSQTWRRAAIVEISGSNAKVFYSDFACIETVPLANLKELAPQFMGFGDAAIKCHLCGIVPADGRDEWPTITKEYLKELLDAYTRVFITKLGNFKDKSMPIEVWVYHTIQGGALEPNKSEWRCLNKKIVEQGLAVPDKSLAQNSTDTDPGQNDELSSFLKNVTGSVDEWLQLEPIPTKPVVLPVKGESPNSGEDEEEDRPSEGADSSNTVFITDWLPPEPLQLQEFTAMPTYIDNEGVIYLHDVQQKETLELIRKALDVRYRAPDPKSRYTRWTVGEPCVALYYLDSRFYRGRVLEVNTENSTCLIQYVDYGNEELCSFENLRKSIPLHQIPIQAHRCMLGRIRPAGVGGRWDRYTLDYIHKSIVEKHCLVKVTGPPINGIIPINLKYDKLCINDHLVEFEMAVYVDGSKAAVPKFAGDRRRREPEPQPAAEADSSGPDYIVEGSDTGSCLSLDGKDWNELIQQEEDDLVEGKFIAYPKNNLTEFTCIVPFVKDATTLELTLVHDEETTAVYESLFEEVQGEGYEQSPINGMFENKACIAIFPEDGKWYRAAVLEYSEARGKVKVRYVDYGNVAVVSLAEVREIADAWAELPPATVTARLSGVRPNPETPVADLNKACTETFLDKGPFQGKVVKIEDKDSIPYVELRDATGNLVYENLIQSGLFLKDPIP